MKENIIHENEIEGEEDEVEEEEEKKEEIFEFPPKYGLIYLEDKIFNHHRDLGENCIQYKPEKIIIWLGEKNKENILAGIEITYRNIIDGARKEYKNCLGENIKDKYVFIIKPTEYLINFKIWIGDDGINKVYFLTNKGNEFTVGHSKGNEDIKIDNFQKSQIILFFHGNYNKYLTALTPILIQRETYIKILFEGYFLLKAFLRKKEKGEIIFKKMENNEFSDEEIALIRVCLLSDNPFNGIIKFCIV